VNSLWTAVNPLYNVWLSRMCLLYKLCF